MNRLPRSTLTLLAVLAALVIVTGTVLLTARSPEDRLAALAPRADTLPSLPARSAANSVDFSRVREAALFYATRTYLPPPDPTRAGPPRPDYQFVAVMILPNDRSVAYLRSADRSTVVKVRLGESLGGWPVVAIEPRRVLLSLDGQQVEITSSTPASVPGLSRVTLSAPAAAPKTGVRVLGNASGRAAASVPTRVETEARLYRPPQ